MKPALIMSLEGVWYVFQNGAWQVFQKRPELAGTSRILTDFDGAPAGVMTVDTKPEFAPSMIEKRMRSEGLVDGESHILSHRLIYAGGSCRVLYTAVPIGNWNEMFAWLGDESSLGLVFSIEATMLSLARRHGAVMCRAGRQFRFLVSTAGRLAYVTTTAFSDDPDDLDIALASLMDHADSKPRLSEDHVSSVYWCDLLATESDDGSRLVGQFAQRMGVKVEVAPVKRFDSPAGPLRTAADSMMDAVSWQAAANPWKDRVAAGLDQSRGLIAVAVALVGLGLFSVAAAWTTQAVQMQARAEQLDQEANAISRRIAGQDVSPSQLLASHVPTISFLDNLERATNSTNPLAVLDAVRQAADKRVRVMRVQLVSRDGVFRVDGMPLDGSRTDVALSGFLSALKNAGYRVNAVDPGMQSQLPGFFSYSLRRDANRDGARP